jgi:hypothetical protein
MQPLVDRTKQYAYFLGNAVGDKMRSIAAVMLFPAGCMPAVACSVEEAESNIQMNAITRAAEIAAQQLPMLERFSALSTKAKDPVKPLNQQLSQADLAEFARVQQRFQATELMQLIESNYQRDNKAIQNMFNMAQGIYLGQPEPKEGEENFFYYSVLKLMEISVNDPSLKGDAINVPSQTQNCTMEVAVHMVENESIEKMIKLPLADANKEMAAIRQRTKGNGRDAMSMQDRASYDRLMRTALVPGNHEKSFVDDLEMIKLLARASDLKYQFSKKDAVDSGGDFDSVGKSIDAMNLDGRTKLALLMLSKIGDKYPSDYIQQRRKIQPLVQAAQKPKKPLSLKPQ